VGEFHQNQKHGRGRLIFGDGSVYAGQFVSHLPQGEGNFEYVNKDKYVGEFHEGRKHGKGIYYFSEGTVFDGSWGNDEKTYGTLTLFNGDSFLGSFKNNLRF
jgi:hypothetical protein